MNGPHPDELMGMFGQENYAQPVQAKDRDGNPIMSQVATSRVKSMNDPGEKNTLRGLLAIAPKSISTATVLEEELGGGDIGMGPAAIPHTASRKGGIARAQIKDISLKQGTATPRALMTASAGGLKSGDQIKALNRVWVVVEVFPTAVLLVSPTGIRNWEFKHRLKGYELMAQGVDFKPYLGL